MTDFRAFLFAKIQISCLFEQQKKGKGALPLWSTPSSPFAFVHSEPAHEHLPLGQTLKPCGVTPEQVGLLKVQSSLVPTYFNRFRGHDGGAGPSAFALFAGCP